VRTWFKALWRRLLAWRDGNRDAHKRAPTGTCCASPDEIYAARRSGKSAGETQRPG
jgi:hypothetical protein